MRKHHPKNERIKRQYRIWLQEAKRLAPHSIDQKMAAIALFEVYTNYKDFAAFHIEQARNFKQRQTETINETTEKPLAKATLKSRFDALKAFLLWLADQPGYRSGIKHSDAEYFNLSFNDAAIATAKRVKPSPELEEVHRVIDCMKAETPFEKRARAIIAFTLLTGARDDAIASVSLGHVDLKERVIFQDARDVRTKFRKSFSTWFFPVGGQAETIITDWVRYLQNERQFSTSDPLFPSTLMGLDANGKLGPVGFKRENWKDAGPIRKVFKDAFTSAGLPNFKPHSIRDTITQLGQKICKTPEEFKAWSQNLGHEDVLVTFTSYGQVSSKRQAEIILNLGAVAESTKGTIPVAALEALLANAKGQGKAA
jgi:integrase